jgi:prenylcysteine oxidase/farnesylcysteine lyase
LNINSPRLAVVGAGIGGSSAAYFARKYLPNSEITIYDASDRIGGRILTHKEGDLSLEVGAAFFNPTNKTIISLVNEAGLEVRKIRAMDFAIWDGSEIIFNSNRSMVLSGVKLIARYGQSVTKMLRILREGEKRVVNLYREEIENPTEFEELFRLAGLDRWYRKPFDDALMERGVDSVFIDEIVTPITRTIYSQEANLAGFAGLSSLMGVFARTVYRIAEGNSLLQRHLAEASLSKLELGRKVRSIEKTANGSYRLSTERESKIFDAAIVATPLELAGIEFDGVSAPRLEAQQYQRVYRKAVRGVFDPSGIGLRRSSEPPSMLLTAKGAGPITHIGVQRLSNGESLLSVSSKEPLADDVIHRIFEDGKTVFEHDWKAAYPVFKPLEKIPQTRLDERLIYLDSTEAAVSSMETSALSALNAIRMMIPELK